MTVSDPNVSRVQSINQRTRKILQNRVIPAHKNSPHDAESLELVFFHFIKECRGNFRGGGWGYLRGGGGGGRSTHTLVRDDLARCRLFMG